jgi:hypothetical protein
MGLWLAERVPILVDITPEHRATRSIPSGTPSLKAPCRSQIRQPAPRRRPCAPTTPRLSRSPQEATPRRSAAASAPRLEVRAATTVPQFAKRWGVSISRRISPYAWPPPFVRGVHFQTDPLPGFAREPRTPRSWLLFAEAERVSRRERFAWEPRTSCAHHRPIETPRLAGGANPAFDSAGAGFVGSPAAVLARTRSSRRAWSARSARFVRRGAFAAALTPRRPAREPRTRCAHHRPIAAGARNFALDSVHVGFAE